MMVGHRNLSKSLAIMAALLMALCALAVFTTDDSEAVAEADIHVSASSFTEEETGTIKIIVDNCVEGEEFVVTVKDGSITKVNAKEFIAVEGTNDFSVKFKLSEGMHDVIVTIENEGVVKYNNGFSIECEDNVWTHFSAYAVIVVLIIVVVIIAVVYMRAKPNNKPTTTFTQLEQERKAAASAKDQPAAPAKTEKVKYSSSRRK